MDPSRCLIWPQYKGQFSPQNREIKRDLPLHQSSKKSNHESPLTVTRDHMRSYKNERLVSEISILCAAKNLAANRRREAISTDVRIRDATSWDPVVVLTK